MTNNKAEYKIWKTMKKETLVAVDVPPKCKQLTQQATLANYQEEPAVDGNLCCGQIVVKQDKKLAEKLDPTYNVPNRK